MQSFKTAQASSKLYCHSPFLLRGDNTNRNQMHFSDLGELQHYSPVFQREGAVNLSSNSMFTIKSSNGGVGGSYGTLNTDLGSAEIGSSSDGCLDTAAAGEHLMYQKATVVMATTTTTTTLPPMGNNGHDDDWGDSGVPHNNQQIHDTCTHIDTDARNQCNRDEHGAHIVVDSEDQTKKVKAEDNKIIRRLAQNREAARKSRLRKKAYVQQLENSRAKLAQLELELQRAPQQGIFVATTGDNSHSAVGNGGLAFDMDYARWVDEQQCLLNELRSAVNSQMGDNELQLLVDGVMAHYDELFRLKSIGAKVDVFHMLSGMWKTPTERWLTWLGGYRGSELLKIVKDHLEPLAEQQFMGFCNLQRSSQQAEDALYQGYEALKQCISETLTSASLAPTGTGIVTDYMSQMEVAMSNLANLESFLHQADMLKQKTLQQLQRILTTRQIAKALLVINDYISRLRALNSLWNSMMSCCHTQI